MKGRSSAGHKVSDGRESTIRRISGTTQARRLGGTTTAIQRATEARGTGIARNRSTGWGESGGDCDHENRLGSVQTQGRIRKDLPGISEQIVVGLFVETKRKEKEIRK